MKGGLDMEGGFGDEMCGWHEIPGRLYVLSL